MLVDSLENNYVADFHLPPQHNPIPTTISNVNTTNKSSLSSLESLPNSFWNVNNISNHTRKELPNSFWEYN